MRSSPSSSTRDPAPAPRGGNRRGFTLVELLVVIAIIGVLVGLLLPAINSARESARRTSCSNSLKQIGIAILGYHDQKGKLPSAIRPDPASTIRVGVFTFILPWVEQKSLYDAYDQSVNWSDAKNLPVTSLRVPFYECASSPKHGGQLDQNPDGVTGFGTGIVAVGDYGSNLGIAPGLAATVTGTVTVSGSSVAKSTVIQESSKWQSAAGELTNGFLPKNAALTLADVSDGISNTIAVFESGGRPYVYQRGQQKSNKLSAAHTNGGGWARPASDILFAGSNSAGTSLFGPFFNKTNGHDHASDPYDSTNGYPTPSGIKTEGSSQPYSFHPGGFNTLIGDGAVRFINDETAIEVLCALITRNESGGEVPVSIGAAK